jgi:hypothetical protein
MVEHRPAVTLLQVVVVVVVLGVAGGLAVTALAHLGYEAAREASVNNLRQLGIASLGYHSTFGNFAAANDYHNFSALARLVPFTECGSMNIDFDEDCDDEMNAEPRASIRKPFVSPLDPVTSVVEGAAPTNYQLCAGSKPSLVDNDGVSYQDSKIKFPDITDGTTNTILMGETLKGARPSFDGRDLRRQHLLYEQAVLQGVDEATGVDDWINGRNIVHNRCSAWIDGRFLQCTFTATRVLNDERPDVDCSGFGGLSGLRSVRSATNILMADASVRPITSGIQLEIWKALASRNDGAAIPEF